MKRAPSNPSLAAAALLALAAATGLGACSDEPAPVPRTPETLATEDIAGDFLEYYESVIRLARRHAANPDSFQAALDSLPGSHLTDEQWEVWTAPYREDPVALADHVEAVMADLSGRKPNK